MLVTEYRHLPQLQLPGVPALGSEAGKKRKFPGGAVTQIDLTDINESGDKGPPVMTVPIKTVTAHSHLCHRRGYPSKIWICVANRTMERDGR